MQMTAIQEINYSQQLMSKQGWNLKGFCYRHMHCFVKCSIWPSHFSLRWILFL